MPPRRRKATTNVQAPKALSLFSNSSAKRSLVEVSGENFDEAENERCLTVDEAEFEHRLRRLCADGSGRGAYFLLRLLRRNKMPVESFLDLKEKLQVSFSKLKWTHAYELWQIKDPARIPTFEPEEPYISFEMAETLFNAVEIAEMTVSTLTAAANEAKVVAWLTMVVAHIVSLFRGVVNNDAEGNLRGFDGCGGRVEFVYLVLELCIVVIIEAKSGPTDNDAFAQMMAELEAADYQNVLRNLALDRVSGVLASDKIWYFWQYTGLAEKTPFAVSKLFDVSSGTLEARAKHRLKVFRILYAVFLNGYCWALEAFSKRSTEMASEEASMAGVHPETQPRRLSHEEWSNATLLANKARTLAFAATNDDEFNEAKKTLDESVQAIPTEHSRVLDKYLPALRKMYGR